MLQIRQIKSHTYHSMICTEMSLVENVRPTLNANARIVGVVGVLDQAKRYIWGEAVGDIGSGFGGY